MFATLFYYGTPIWLWLYGVKTTFFLIVYSIGAAFILAVILGAVFDVSEPTAIGVLLQIPVRVIAGNWLARNHVRLRSRSVA
jgi:ABC-type arginine/histidine transport system permease subunit